MIDCCKCQCVWSTVEKLPRGSRTKIAPRRRFVLYLLLFSFFPPARAGLHSYFVSFPEGRGSPLANPPETDPLPPPSRASRLLGETVFLPQSAFCRSVSPVLRLCSRAKHRRVPAGAACKSPPTREFCLFARVFAGLVVCTTPLFALPFAKDDKVGVKSVFLPFLFLLPPHTHIFPLNLPHQCSAVPRLRQMSRISTVVVQTNRHKKKC